ncbi:hypothetical protein NG799_27960, partial [Laspinema sp. D1]|nr:hypothetical protein [Laspinema sp. D2a]
KSLNKIFAIGLLIVATVPHESGNRYMARYFQQKMKFSYLQMTGWNDIFTLGCRKCTLRTLYANGFKYQRSQ